MFLFTKQQQVNEAKLMKRKKPCKGNVKFDTMNPLYGMLKCNNNKLAQVLSFTRNENQMLFSQNVEFSKEIQTLRKDCREREVVITELHKYMTEILRILDPLTNVITKSIQVSKKFIPEEQIVNQQGNAVQAVIENDGTTPSIIANHDIGKVAVERSKANNVQINNIELPAIEEESTEFMNNPTEIANSMPSTSYATRREQNLRLRRRISKENAASFNTCEETSSIEAYGLSGRLSDVHARRYSEIRMMGQTLSPRVRRGNATIRQSNLHASHIEMSQDSRREDWFNNLDVLSRERNDHMTASELCTSDVQGDHGKSHDAIFHSQATNHPPSNDVIDGGSRKQTMQDQQRETMHSVMPKNQRGWIFCDQSNFFTSWNNNSLGCIEITGKSLNEDAERDKNQMFSEHVQSDEDRVSVTMELTECIKTAQQQQNAANIENVRGTNTEQCTDQNHGLYDRNVRANLSEIRDEPINDPAINISETFITTNRGEPLDADDEDTMIQYFGRTAQNRPFCLNELRLPILNDITTSQRDKTKPAATGTTDASRRSSTSSSGDTSIDLPPSPDIKVQNTSSDSCTLLLSISKRTSTPNKPRKKWKRIIKPHNDYDQEMSSSDCDERTSREKLTIKNNEFETKQSSSVTSKQAGSSQSNVRGCKRPRRAKAPTNLKEPLLNTKLRRN